MAFSEMQVWYDGYFFKKVGHVIEAIDNEEFANYWTMAETYESLVIYIAMDFAGLKQKIVNMLYDQRYSIDVEPFQNDMVSFKFADDILTLLY